VAGPLNQTNRGCRPTRSSLAVIGSRPTLAVSVRESGPAVCCRLALDGALAVRGFDRNLARLGLLGDWNL
jgi:hypothetical protein